VNGGNLRDVLQPEGYEVAEAGSGEAALELYGRIQPDLVLIDVVLPGMNGFATCRRLRERWGGTCAPVIFITSQNDPHDFVEGLAAGGVDYLSKPFHLAEALARIWVHLQNRLLNRQQAQLVEELRQANDTTTRLLGLTVHDLRNPLASIRGLAEFLRDGTVGTLTPEQLELVDSIHEASQSMLALLKELPEVPVVRDRPGEDPAGAGGTVRTKLPHSVP
jgi:DNA-binding response OmpR family regulator